MNISNRFNFWNSICAAVAFVVSAFTYLTTIEPSASFWDCGEFIASSYKLEVGHPPGNPVFQLFARIFTLLGDNMHAAVLVNSLSALCSALTIFFLYLTIVWLAKRMVSKNEDGSYSTGAMVAIFGSGLVGSLVYCFSDTFWFSAVEGEVYAMSSLFTAIVFWAMTKWYDQADSPRSGRWIVLIAFLMGLSIGVHLLNLLAIPALVFMFYYRRREDKPFKFGELVKILLIGAAITGVLVFIFIPWLPKLAAYFDLFFVNVLKLPYNTGAAFFMVALLGVLFWGIFKTLDDRKVFWNTTLLCITAVTIGFSLFSIDIIRSCAKTPTNEYQPDNAFTLVRYLSREQYGSTPLVYGQYFDAPYDLENSDYWAPVDGKYKKVPGPVNAKYKSEGKMLFPRMWSSSPDGRYEKFYECYTGGKGTRVQGASHRKPTTVANLAYFFDYQVNWMYWRYFMWNFVGRQNDVHSPSPGNIFYGNWESGIGFIDHMRLGDQSDAPAILSHNKGKNHYFFLPLILGLLGLFFQFGRDKRGCWLTFLMFFMTGLAIVMYLNQPPYQVRERDYAYAGSFYFFSIWCGLAVLALYTWTTDALKGRLKVPAAGVLTAACLCVPALMAAQNWDDHDRSNRATAVELAANYLNSVGPDGIIITHGDNDTFPIWYAQEVEGIRTDVRLCNTSLLGTDWHIDQMKYAVNDSRPLDITVPASQYLYGTNEYIPIVDSRGEPMLLSDAMRVFTHPKLKVSLSSGRKVDYIPARKLIVPVNKANAVACGIVSAERASQIPDSIIITIPESKDYLSKPELFVLDLLSNYRWDRPLHMLNMGGDLNVGLKEYLENVGYSYKFIPFKNTPTAADSRYCDADALYNRMKDVYSFDALARGDYYIDYQNLYTHLGVMSVRQTFLLAARALRKNGEPVKAVEMLDRGVDVMRHYPLESICIGFSNNDYMVVQMVAEYYTLGERDKALALAQAFGDELVTSGRFYYNFIDYGKDDFDLVANYLYFLTDEMTKAGDSAPAHELQDRFNAILKNI